MKTLRVALCQLNTVVGDIDGNTKKICQTLAEAEDAGCCLAVFPELAICGYPPEDLLMKNRFIRDTTAALEKIAAQTSSCFAIVGFPSRLEDSEHRLLKNSAAVCGNGKILTVIDKTHLPNYAVFDEHRYFSEGQPCEPVEINTKSGSVKVGVTICEDLWIEDGAVAKIVDFGAEVVININASPYHLSKWSRRQHLLESRSKEYGIPFVYVNQVGGQDELVFDGQSMVYDSSGGLLARCPQFCEAVQIVDVPVESVDVPVASQNPQPYPIAPLLEPLAEIYEALKLGTSDYIAKNGFSDVCVGLSGGIDSSLVATIAADAVGPSRVHGVLMPSRYSSDHSLSDAKQLCINLGIDYRIMPIEPAHQALLDMLHESLSNDLGDLGLTEENLQSRIRGIVLMALANHQGWLNLTTGNKSESAVGYSTLYGDTAGAFAVIKDVWKQQVYALAQWRNAQLDSQADAQPDSQPAQPPIPPNVLTKAPSAELRPNQRDDETLPPYDVLDPILFALVEQDLTAGDMSESGYDPVLVARISKLIDTAEYKRRQNPPGIRITRKAFGKDRRMPITHKYLGIARSEEKDSQQTKEASKSS